jgi:hypothetical protein
VDEARKVIRRLERIEALQGADAPAGELLDEVRLLLSEGEAWLAAERTEADADAGLDPGDRLPGRVARAELALEGCRASLTRHTEVMPETADSTSL